MRDAGLAIDHVLVAVSDLATAAEWWRASYGLGSVPGGEFPDQGLSTAIIPVGGTQYVELVAGLGHARESCIDWAVATSDIESVATRLGRPVAPGSIELSGGGQSNWRCVDADPESGLPFFIQYENAQLRVARWQERFALARHDREPVGLAALSTPAGAEALKAWLGSTLDGVTADAPGLGFSIRMADGSICEGPSL